MTKIQAISDDLRKLGIALVVIAVIGALLKGFVPLWLSVTTAVSGVLAWIAGMLLRKRIPDGGDE
jgi:uncharacterized protein YqfA (UPF0365 family)